MKLEDGEVTFGVVEVSDPRFERDGLRFVTAKSRALGRRADMTLWVPEASRVEHLLILLHGVYGSHHSWAFKGGAHLRAQQLLEAGVIEPVAIAMPSDGLLLDGSAYLRWPSAEDVES